MNLQLLRVAVCLALLGVISTLLHAQEPSTPQPSNSVTLFQNVRVFDGKSSTLSAPTNVLVRGNKIEKISSTPFPLTVAPTWSSSMAAAAR